jgi:hypothetical protein
MTVSCRRASARPRPRGGSAGLPHRRGHAWRFHFDLEAATRADEHDPAAAHGLSEVGDLGFTHARQSLPRRRRRRASRARRAARDRDDGSRCAGWGPRPRPRRPRAPRARPLRKSRVAPLSSADQSGAPFGVVATSAASSTCGACGFPRARRRAGRLERCEVGLFAPAAELPGVDPDFRRHPVRRHAAAQQRGRFCPPAVQGHFLHSDRAW